MRTITRKELKDLYSKYDTRTLASMLGVSVPTLYKYLEEANIELKGKGKGSRQHKKIQIID